MPTLSSRSLPVCCEEPTGFEIGSLLLSLFFASRVFRSTIDTLDSAYRVEERRGTFQLRGLGFLFSVGAIIVVVLIVSLIVIGPLLGGARAIADSLGLGQAFELAWHLARWPVSFLLAVAFLSLLYRFGPNARCSWRESLPGAIFGVIGIIVVAAGFRSTSKPRACIALPSPTPTTPPHSCSAPTGALNGNGVSESGFRFSVR
jgi:membrane protein